MDNLDDFIEYLKAGLDRIKTDPVPLPPNPAPFPLVPFPSPLDVLDPAKVIRRDWLGDFLAAAIATLQTSVTPPGVIPE